MILLEFYCLILFLSFVLKKLEERKVKPREIIEATKAIKIHPLIAIVFFIVFAIFLIVILWDIFTCGIPIWELI